MIIVRLFHWALRMRVLPDGQGGLRPPTFDEAWTGVSNT